METVQSGCVSAGTTLRQLRLVAVPPGLLEPRLYRAAFAPALFALIILAFSLQDPSRSVQPELSPPGFSAARATVFARQAVTNYGARESGSIQDARLADLVEARFDALGFRTESQEFSATTLAGERELVNILGVRPGPSDRRLVVVASRDGAPGKLERSGAIETGMLIELARVLAGRAFDHTIVLASVTGGVDGGLGARELASKLGSQVDGVLVLRNVGAESASSPVLNMFDARLFPDERYTKTVERIAEVELGRGPEPRELPAQLIRLGFPVALGEQASMPAAGQTATALSPGGEPLKPPAADAPQLTAQSGQTVLRTLTTLDTGFRPEPPAAAPLRVGGKLIPQWAFVVLIGTLLFPLIVAAIDGWARGRRWHQPAQRGLIAPPIALVWLLLIGLLLRAVALSGVIDAPPLPPDPSALHGAGATAIGLFAALLSGLGVLVAAAAARQATAKGGEAGFALWIAFSGVAVFVVNPIAAGFLLLLLHLIVLTLLTGGSGRRQLAALAVVGLLPLLVVWIYYASSFDLSVFGSLRYLVMLESGGFIGIAAVAAGCALAASLGTALIQLWWSAPKARRGGPSLSPFAE